MSRNIVFEGWLTKSPPSKRIWRTKWRRRWFALRQSSELPGQYFLDYYADRNCRRLKGTINLELCEQVDAGLHMERAGNGTLDPKLRGSVFTIQTQSRTYHLEADCEAEMEKWVDAICRVCGLRAAEDNSNVIGIYQNTTNVRPPNVNSDNVITTGPYIPISECITGVRSQDNQRAFTFDTGNIVVSTQRQTCDKATETNEQHIYNQPQIKITSADSENESNQSDEDCKSLNASQSNIRPPVPPRPPKTFAKNKDVIKKESFQGPKVQEPVDPVQESIANYTGPGTPWLRIPRRVTYTNTTHSPGRLCTRPCVYSNDIRNMDDEDEYNPGIHYYNLPSLPPAVDRALKPRYSSHSIGHINNYMAQGADDVKPDALQYLDLDLHTTKPPSSKNSAYPRRVDTIHGRYMSALEADSAYKTVDFLKTEAFNITRQDAEASRSHQY